MRTSRNIRLGWAVGLAVSLILGSAVVSHAALAIKKPFTLDITPFDLINGTQDAVMTIKVTNKTTTQSLGSCDIWQTAFTLHSTDQPQPSPGTATITGNVLHLRSMSIAAMDSRTVHVHVDAPTTDGLYTWSVECRQANNFSPDQPSNKFTLDGANSNRTTNVYTPGPSADVAVTGNDDSLDPVVGANTVEYTVTVHNNSGGASGSLTLTDSLPNGGAITSFSAPAPWSCSGTGAQTVCTHPAIAGGTDAEAVIVRVLAPNDNTIITNRAHIAQSGTSDPNLENNTSDEDTTVKTDISCDSGFVSCAIGQVVFNIDSQVTSGSSTNATRYLVGTASFLATTTPGSVAWGMAAPQTPGTFCPTSLADTDVTQCTFQMNADPFPAPYVQPGKITLGLICDVSKCPKGLLSGAGVIMVIVHEDDSHDIIPPCTGGNGLCFDQEPRNIGQPLRVTVRNLVTGDPRIAGVCVGGGC